MPDFFLFFRRFVQTAIVVFLPLSVYIAVHLANGGSFAFERPLMFVIHEQTGQWFFPIALLLHYLGKTAVAVPLVCLAAVCLWRFGKLRAAVFVPLAALLPTLNMLWIKAWIQRPRPLLWPRAVEEVNFSFPSGHSTFSAAVAVMLILLCYRTAYLRTAFAVGILFALLTGFSRVYLGVHYPTDVWAGWTNGMLTALLVYYVVFKKDFE